ncbi:hypothetical protein ACFL15_00210 [Patescibacteria group bacterium]
MKNSKGEDMCNYGLYDMWAFRNERKSILIPRAIIAVIVIFLVALAMYLLGVGRAWIIGVTASLLSVSLIVFLVMNLLLKNHQLETGGD